MIGINKAIELIEKNKSTSETEILDLKSALGHTTAKDVFSQINMPPFNQSAMDGYAIHHDSSISTYTIIGEIQAGMNPSEFNLKKAEAVRIFLEQKLQKDVIQLFSKNGASKKIQRSNSIKKLKKVLTYDLQENKLRKESWLLLKELN